MLIDEWQTIPKLWDTVRYTVDHRRKMGQFILTGFAVPDKEAEKEREHSGAGRFARLTMRPMTLFESGESNGSVSLAALFTTPGKCVRDLRVFAEALNGKVYHYRDKSGLECDAVVHLRNGQYGLIEIKLGGQSLINDGATTLNALAARIDTSRMKAPAFKMILTATGEYAYRRPEDGIYVVPVGCLKPYLRDEILYV